MPDGAACAVGRLLLYIGDLMQVQLLQRSDAVPTNAIPVECRTWCLAIEEAPGVYRFPVGRYGYDIHWTLRDEAEHFACEERRLLTHLGHPQAGRVVVREFAPGDIPFFPPPVLAVPMSLPPDLLWASGGGPYPEGEFVGLCRGRRVVAVRRFVHFVPPERAPYMLSGVTAYWTSVIESALGSESPMAFNSARFYADAHTPYDELTQKAKCVRAARLFIEAETTED